MIGFDKMNKVQNNKSQSGFSLVELSIAMICIGLLMAGTLFIVNTTKHRLYLKDTRDKMNKIADHLSNYAQLHNRLPCPASGIRQNYSDGTDTRAAHFGDERAYVAGNVADLFKQGDCFDNGVNSRGIVPYRALGLDEGYARDAWGRYFTYVVSPVSARYNTFDLNPNQIHRAASWYLDANPRFSQWPKFNFCHGVPGVPQPDGTGPDINTATQANDIQYNNQPAGSFAYNRGSANVNVMSADRTYTHDYVNGGANPQPHTRRIAFALISHGPKGQGSYLGNETNNKLDPGYFGINPRPSESTNANIPAGAPNNVVSIEFADGNAAPALLFDDLVMVKTQDQIFGRLGGQSCVTP